MNRSRLKIISSKELPVYFNRFYAVGLLLYVIYFTRPLFISLIPFSLLLVISIVFFYHRNWNIKSSLWFIFIILSSFLLEVKGVETGLIFGVYLYDKGLGLQWYGVPLIIGLNWLFLVYASHDLAKRITKNNIGAVFLGASLMILYDIIMEWVAPLMHMWYFPDGYPPLANFIVWFLVALVYHTGFEILHIRTNNLPARSLFITQLIFFLLIDIYNSIFLA